MSLFPPPEAAAIATGSGERFIDGYLAYLLAQASSRISHEFHREVNEAGLSVTEWRVLASLSGSAGESIGSLSQLALTKQPTLSKVVQRMEQEGLVSRTRVKADRRQTVVVLTPKGLRLTEGLRERALQHQAAVLQPFGADNARMLLGMLRELLTLHPPDLSADPGEEN
ncbi:MarR family winged helix-turn-helix transcriptional regulator [Azoarcus olearius]|uniref:MarR-family transcriptional regulator n=1 Tax=Azoarcus sp. (strain BH72) TaxID=418699 RepID=A1K6U7_AZOSB|nr:MarR family winged helix-turn-helix transcriptional regulator [Azoarcus olearius]CAL94552.1 putative MarR-family transcriptional regulator [Azoarcus olearius]